MIYSYRGATNGVPTTDVGQTVPRGNRHATEPVRLGEADICVETEKQQPDNETC